MKTCKDCGIEIHPEANHTGCEQWCEDCFDNGLHKDMNDHFKNFVAIDYAELEIKVIACEIKKEGEHETNGNAGPCPDSFAGFANSKKNS